MRMPFPLKIVAHMIVIMGGDAYVKSGKSEQHPHVHKIHQGCKLLPEKNYMRSVDLVQGILVMVDKPPRATLLILCLARVKE